MHNDTCYTLLGLIYFYLFVHLLQLYKILNELGTIKMLISTDEWCDGLPQILRYDGYGVPDGHSTNGSLALIFSKHWVPNPFPEFPEYDLLSDMCALG
jgi:hypothetical protein